MTFDTCGSGLIVKKKKTFHFYGIKNTVLLSKGFCVTFEVHEYFVFVEMIFVNIVYILLDHCHRAFTKYWHHDTIVAHFSRNSMNASILVRTIDYSHMFAEKSISPMTIKREVQRRKSCHLPLLCCHV